jgi:ligand-binding SRPBCC domain-containing protein
LRVPGFALGLALGEAAGVLLGGQRVNPARLRALSFGFRFERVEQALADIAGTGADVEVRRIGDHALPDSDYLRERGARYLLRQTIVLDAPIDEVFAFFSRAENLGAITPPDMGFTITTPRPIPMAAGTRITYDIKLGPVPLAWETVIDAWEPGERFVDSQRSGPYRSWWHEHRFRAMGHRTIMEDRVYYSPPLGPLGWIAQRLFIARELRRIFGYRSVAIEQRFGARAIQTGIAA